MIKRYLLLGLILFGTSATSGHGLQLGPPQSRAEKEIRARRIEGGIVIDGELDEPEWNLEEPITDFLQHEPQTGEPASELTEVRILYDAQNLYNRCVLL